MCLKHVTTTVTLSVVAAFFLKSIQQPEINCVMTSSLKPSLKLLYKIVLQLYFTEIYLKAA